MRNIILRNNKINKHHDFVQVCKDKKIGDTISIKNKILRIPIKQPRFNTINPEIINTRIRKNGKK